MNEKELFKILKRRLENSYFGWSATDSWKAAGALRKQVVSGNWQCPICKCDMKASPFDIDHRRPKSAGGGNEIANLRVTCASCNRSKGAVSDKRLSREQPKPSNRKPIEEGYVVIDSGNLPDGTRWEMQVPEEWGL